MIRNPGRRAILAAAIALATAGAAVEAPADAAAASAEEEVAVVGTPQGEIVWRFLPDAAPGTSPTSRS